MRATEGALCVTEEDHRDLERWYSERIVQRIGPSNSAVRMRAELQLQWLAGHLPGTEINCGTCAIGDSACPCTWRHYNGAASPVARAPLR